MEQSKYQLKRYDLSEDRSLRPWSAADELLVQSHAYKEASEIGIYGDRFGYLACHLNEKKPLLVAIHKSEELAISANLKANNLPEPTFYYPISPLPSQLDHVLLKVPKSLDLFHLYLEHIAHNSKEEVQVTCAFMTRNFTPALVKIAELYFEEVSQSKATKKARVLFLRKKKPVTPQNMNKPITYNTKEYHQYWGVFSASHIDYATQFFIENMDLSSEPETILDLGSGNGVIGAEVQSKLPNAEIHLMDDSYLAVASSQYNVSGKKVQHHYHNDLSIFEEGALDLIVSNPPFHFEHEINIQIPLALFKGCHRSLKVGGNLQIVSNKHLNYKVHLDKLFTQVKISAQDEKFVVYACVK